MSFPPPPLPGRRAPDRRSPSRHAPARRSCPPPVRAALPVVAAAVLATAAVLVAALPPPSAAVRLLPAVRAGEPPSPSVRTGGPVWPLAGRPAVVRGWEPPAGPYGPGHRGVDLAARAGDTVVAAATGRVSFAGRVAGRGVLVVELAGSGAPPLRTTYEPVRALVAKGDEVVAGRPVGLLEAGPFHCPEGCLHWGLRRGEAYLNPLSLLRRGPSRLLPVFTVPEP